MPEISAEDYLIAGLWAAAAVGSVWVWVPVVITSLGGTIYQNGGEEDPVALEPDGTDPAYESIYTYLTAHGYEPLGPAFMNLYFYGRKWVNRTRVRTFRSRAGGSFAFVQELSFAPGCLTTHFASCWENRGLLLTFGDAAGRVEAGNYVSQGFPNGGPSELDDHHRKEVEELRKEGWRPDPDLSLTTLLVATAAHATVSTRHPIAAHFEYARPFAVLHLGVTAVIAWWTGFWHWTGPTACLAGLGLYLIIVVPKEVAVARAYRQRVEEDREREW
jgi:hypothetical protein